jgi:thiamine pyrophosphokinase
MTKAVVLEAPAKINLTLEVLGRRADGYHELSSVFATLDLRAVDGEDEIRCVRDHAEIAGAPGDLVTLLAVTRTVSGVSTNGLAYPLHEATLRRGDSRGVSNVLESERGGVRVRRGVLLLVHRAGGDPNALTTDT